MSVLRSLPGRYEPFAQRHPWLAAMPVALLAAAVCVIVTVVTGGPPAGSTAVVIFCAAWVLLGATLRTSSRLP